MKTSELPFSQMHAEEAGASRQAQKKVDPDNFRSWFSLGAWLPFSISLILWVIYAKLITVHNTNPVSNFFDNYNPRERDDVKVVKGSSTIPFGPMVVFYFVLMLLTASVSELILPWKHSSNKKVLFYRFLTVVMGFCDSYLLMNALTDFLKFRIGALRPDFVRWCFGPDHKPEDLPETIHSIDDCPTKDLDNIREGMVSFPSGHSSASTNMGLFITFYILWCLYIRSRPQLGQKLKGWKSIVLQGMSYVALVPFFLALGVAASRLTDFRHHFADVVMGTLLGAIFASLIFIRTISHIYDRV